MDRPRYADFASSLNLANGAEAPANELWFAWAAFNPDAQVYRGR